jgi:hypothetical protein
MTWRGIGAVLLVLLLLPACGRRHVVPRDSGRVDSERGIMTSSDPQWTVEHEPLPAEGAPPAKDR